MVVLSRRADESTPFPIDQGKPFQAVADRRGQRDGAERTTSNSNRRGSTGLASRSIPKRSLNASAPRPATVSRLHRRATVSLG